MDNDPLPYPIPGPAGGLLSSAPRGRSSTAAPSHKHSRHSTAAPFATASWHAMHRHLDLPPHGTRSLSSSLALLRRNALLHLPALLTGLPVLVRSLDWVGRDASCSLHDPTAVMSATIHADAFASASSARPSPIRVGAVLLLRDVRAFAFSNAPAGVRVDPAAAVHLIILPAHIQHVFPTPSVPTPSSPSARLQQKTDEFLAVYTPYARSPPPVRPRPRPHPPPSVPAAAPSAAPSSVSLTRPASRPTPFRPPSRVLVQPNAATSRKRPLSHPSTQPSTIPPTRRRPALVPQSLPHASQPIVSSPADAHVAPPITDDHLDSLLGDFDMDAVIAAHSRTSDPISQTPATSTAPNPDPSPHSTAIPKQSEVSNPAPPPPSTPTPPPPSAPTDSLSGIKESDIDNLFDGLDATDFD